jgi:hypothetical protein
MIYLVPHFFIHRWELKKGVKELMIDIPDNIKDILIDTSIPPSQIGFSSFISEKILIERSSIFSKSLLC